MPQDVSQLMDALGSASAADRLEAPRQLARAGESARGAAVPLVRAMGDEEEEVREWAASALEEMGPPSHDDVPALGELLSSKTASDVRYWAATLLGRAQDARAVEPLIQALSSDDLAVRERAAWALGRIGPAARAAIEPLRAAASSDQARLARVASRALEQVSS